MEVLDCRVHAEGKREYVGVNAWWPCAAELAQAQAGDMSLLGTTSCSNLKRDCRWSTLAARARSSADNDNDIDDDDNNNKKKYYNNIEM